MSYSDRYTRLLMAGAEQQANALQQQAEARAQGLVGSANAWAQVPGQVVDAARGAFDQYQKQKMMTMRDALAMRATTVAERRATAMEGQLELSERRQQALAEKQATDADLARKKDEEDRALAARKVAADALEKGGDIMGEYAKASVQSADLYRARLPKLRSIAALVSTAIPELGTITIPEEWSTDATASITQVADAMIRKYSPKDTRTEAEQYTAMTPEQQAAYRTSVGALAGARREPDKPPVPGSPEWVATAPLADVRAVGVRNRLAHPLAPSQASTDDAKIEEAARNIVNNPQDLVSLKTVSTMRGDQRISLFNAIKRISPDFPIGMIDRRIAFLDKYENPASRAAINRGSMNNILQHAGDLSDVNKKYRRSNLRLANTVMNVLANQYDPVYTEYMVPVTVLQNEIALYFAGGYAPDESQKRQWDKIVAGDATPNQIEAFAKSIIHVGLRRADTHNQQFKTMMGFDDPNLLTPQAVESGIRLGLGDEVRKYGSGGQLGQPQTSTPPPPLPSPPSSGMQRAKNPQGELGWLPASTVLPPGWSWVR